MAPLAAREKHPSQSVVTRPDAEVKVVFISTVAATAAFSSA